MLGLNLNLGGGKGGGVLSTAIPKPRSSIVSPSNKKDIIVSWSHEMQGTGNIKDAINVIIDGATAVHPTAVTFNGKTMTLTMANEITRSQAVTWAYDDQNTTETLESVFKIEADNQTYAVEKVIIRQFSKAFGKAFR